MTGFVVFWLLYLLVGVYTVSQSPKATCVGRPVDSERGVAYLTKAFGIAQNISIY